MRIRRVEPEAWRELADLRLRALADAPSAFSSTLAEARLRSDRQWRDWTARLAAGVATIGFVADDGEALHGLVVGYERTEQPERVALVSLWVAPESRGRGLGSALVERVVEWAEDRGADAVTLWVNEENAAAVGLYERAGFTATGARQPFASAPEVAELEFALTLPR
jgi:ribosomal protein S18 acetylase RimI-like enzyme